MVPDKPVGSRNSDSDLDPQEDLDDALIARGVQILRSGGVVAFPTDTVFGLGADGLNEMAVRRVFKAKGRQAASPVPLLIGGVDSLELIALTAQPYVDALAEAFWPGPMTLVLPARPEIPDSVTAGTGTVGVRVPDHPVPIALIDGLGGPIVGTSANPSGTPPTGDAAEVAANLAGSVDLVIPGECGVAGQGGVAGLPSTVIDCTSTPPRITRNGGLEAHDVLRVIQEGHRGLKGH